jgi:hypothetical protein
MKRLLTLPFFWIIIVAFLLVLAYLSLVIKVDYSDNIPIENANENKCYFDLFNSLKEIKPAYFETNFPYEKYADSAGFRKINFLLEDLIIMDTLNPGNNLQNQQVLSVALTEKLEEQIRPKFEKYNPDSLIMIIQWAEKYEAYAEVDPEHATLFQVISSHWFNFASNTLRNYYDKEYTIKYNYKFRYINNRLRERKYLTTIKATYTEKVIDYIIQKKWSYLFNKFWYATGILYKSIVGLLVLIIIFPYFYIFKNIINKS